jgi:hypothetical protein
MPQHWGGGGGGGADRAARVFRPPCKAGSTSTSTRTAPSATSRTCRSPSAATPRSSARRRPLCPRSARPASPRTSSATSSTSRCLALPPSMHCVGFWPLGSIERADAPPLTGRPTATPTPARTVARRAATGRRWPPTRTNRRKVTWEGSARRWTTSAAARRSAWRTRRRRPSSSTRTAGAPASRCSRGSASSRPSPPRPTSSTSKPKVLPFSVESPPAPCFPGGLTCPTLAMRRVRAVQHRAPAAVAGRDGLPELPGLAGQPERAARRAALQG